MEEKKKGKDLESVFFKEVLDSMADGVFIVDAQGNIIYWNEPVEKISGYHASEVLGKNAFSDYLKHYGQNGLELASKDNPIFKALHSSLTVDINLYISNKNGEKLPVLVSTTPIKDSSGHIIGAVELLKENYEILTLQEKIRELSEKVFIDEFTGIPNKRFIQTSINSRLNELKRYGNSFGILFIDIDQYSNIVERYGKEKGELAIKTAANVIYSNTRVFDMIGRWGEREFVAIMLNVNDDELSIAANRLKLFIQKTGIKSDSLFLSITASIGGTLASKGDTMRSLISRAEELSFKAKMESGNKVVTDKSS